MNEGEHARFVPGRTRPKRQAIRAFLYTGAWLPRSGTWSGPGFDGGAQVRSRGDAGVAMMQAADMRNGDHLAASRRLDRTRDGRVAVERQVRAGFVVVREVRAGCAADGPR